MTVKNIIFSIWKVEFFKIVGCLFLVISNNSHAVDNLSIVCNGKSSTIKSNSESEIVNKETRSYELKQNKLQGDLVSCDCVDVSKNKIVCNGRVGNFRRALEIDRLSGNVKEVNITEFPKFTSTEEFNGVCKVAKRKF